MTGSATLGFKAEVQPAGRASNREKKLHQVGGRIEPRTRVADEEGLADNPAFAASGESTAMSSITRFRFRY